MFHIRELREAKGINMREAARLLNMPYTTYVNYEKGLREPTSEVLIQIADFYGTTIDFLVGRKTGNIPSSVHSPTETSKYTPSDEDIQFALFGGNDEITESMYEEVKKFAAYVKQREGYNK